MPVFKGSDKKWPVKETKKAGERTSVRDAKRRISRGGGGVEVGAVVSHVTCCRKVKGLED